MELVIWIVVIIVILFFVELYKNNKYKKQLINKLINAWGKDISLVINKDKIDKIKSYYNLQIDKENDIDDITWNDFDMDEIFCKINHTSSTIGEEYLYNLLRKPVYNLEELEHRNKLINYFSKNQNDRLLIQTQLSKFGKLINISFYKYLNKLDGAKTKGNLYHYLMDLSLIVSVVIIFIKPQFGILLALLCLSNNIINYYKTKAEIEHYFITLTYILKLLNISKNIKKHNITEISSYNEVLNNTYNKFKKFKKGSSVLITSNVSDSITDMLLDYLRMIFHIDLIKFNNMIKIFILNKEDIIKAYEAVGMIDSLIAIASYRETLKFYSVPNFNKNNVNLKIKDVYHPLINNPVENSICENGSVLLTGSNASGKSTFLKTVGINAILSQTIYTSLSSHHETSFFRIYSSMALKDNLFNNESYYIVEIKSLKRIIEASKGDIPTLCFIDEVLRGTNTLERIAASSRILKELSELNSLAFAATHDIELTYILNNYYKNYHFREEIVKDNIIFDYKLYSGRSKTKNAIKLLEMFGYNEKLIMDSNQAIDYFNNNSKWEVISL